MDKIFIVIGITGSYEDKTETIRYAGNNEEKAFKYQPDDDGFTHTLYIEIWVNDKQVKGYYKDNEDWKINFDKTEELKRIIENQKRQLEETEQELKKLEQF